MGINPPPLQTTQDTKQSSKINVSKEKLSHCVIDITPLNLELTR